LASWVKWNRRTKVGIRNSAELKEKVLIQALLSLGRELSGGSKNLICRRIFGFAKLIVGSESVGSAANNVGSGKSVVRNHAERPSGQAAEKWHKDSKRLSEKHGVMLKRRGSKAQLQTGSNPRQRKCKGSAHVDPDCGTYTTQPEHS